MEDGQDAPLQDRVKINQHIPAADNVQARERRIHGDVLAGEGTHIADALGDLVMAIDLDEKAPEALRRDIDEDVFVVEAGAGFLDASLVQVGCKNLNEDVFGGVFQIFGNDDGEGISFFAGGAAATPDTQGRSFVPVFEELRQDALFQDIIE